MEVASVKDPATESEMQTEADPSNSKFHKKRNNFLRKIRQQMEFYFGDSNLAKDKFLREQLGENLNGYVDVDLFLKFNKVLALTSDVQDIVDAVDRSSVFEVSSDRKQLRRKFPVERTDFDDCTIYVERLPPYANHQYLRDVFNRFGKVTHTSIPHFKASRKFKGFAFVEFESPNSVVEVRKHFKASAESGESDTGEESDDLRERKSSGKAKKSQGHCKDHQSTKGKDSVAQHSSKKRRRTESESSERLGTHRRSLEFEDAGGKSNKHPSEMNIKNEVVDSTQSTSELESCDEKGEMKPTGARDHPEAGEPKSDVVPPHKSGRKRKRRDADNESSPKKLKHEQSSGDAGDAAKPQVHICGSDNESKPTADSKNKSGGRSKEYLKQSSCEAKSEAVVSSGADENDRGLQAAVGTSTKMGTDGPDSNQALSKRQKKRQRKKKNKADDDKPHLRVLTKAEWKTYRNKYLALQRASMVHIKKMLFLENQHSHLEENADVDADFEEDNYEQSPVKEERSHDKDHLKIQHGVIIKLKLSEPVENCQKFIKRVKSLANVSYVDATEGSSEAYVRCPSTEAVSTILEEARFAELGDAAALEDDEVYWNKIFADRDASFKKKTKCKKRGREKLLARAAKMMGMNTNVPFDE